MEEILKLQASDPELEPEEEDGLKESGDIEEKEAEKDDDEEADEDDEEDTAV